MDACGVRQLLHVVSSGQVEVRLGCTWNEMLIRLDLRL